MLALLTAICLELGSLNLDSIHSSEAPFVLDGLMTVAKFVLLTLNEIPPRIARAPVGWEVA